MAVTVFEDLRRILSLPELAIASGQFGEFTGLDIFAYNGAIGTTEQTLWPHTADHAHPASATTMTVSSDDAADAAAGTGAREVTITGLDANYAVVIESKTLNGTTAVTTTNAFLRINGLDITDAGSGGENAGVVYIGTGTVTAGVPADVFGLIDKTENTSHHSFWTVPAGFTAFIPGYRAVSYGTAASVADIRFRIRDFGFFFRTVHRFKITRGDTNGRFFIPLPLLERTDFQIRAAADTGNIDVACNVNFVIGRNQT